MLNTSAAPMCSEVMTVQSVQTSTLKTFSWDDFDGIINFLAIGTTANIHIGNGVSSVGRFNKIVIVSRMFTTVQRSVEVVVQSSQTLTYVYMVPNNNYLLIQYGSSPVVIGAGPDVTRTQA